MEFVFCFDLCAAIALIAIIASLIVRKMMRGRTYLLFLTLSMSILGSAVFSMWDCSYDFFIEKTAYNLYLRHVVEYLFFIFHNSTAPLFLLFVISYLGVWHKFFSDRKTVHLFVVPCVIIFIMMIINMFNGKVFYFNEDMVYVRGSWMVVWYSIAFMYLIVAMVVVILNGKAVPISKRIVMIGFLPLNILSVGIQMMYPNFKADNFASTVSLLTLAVGILRPEEMIDHVVGTESYSAFLMEVEKNSNSNNPMSVLLIKFVNHAVLRNSIGHDMYNSLLRKISDKLYQISKIMNTNGQVYYLDQGEFAVIATGSKYGQMMDMGRVLAAYMQENINVGQLEIQLDARTCILRTPDDIDDKDSLLNFTNTFHNVLPEDRRLMALSAYAGSNDFKMKNNMDAIINRGIQNYNFEMYYQPIYSISKKKFVSAEALIRLKDDQYGFVPPSLFIPAAEESGAIHEIGDFVLEDVCRFIGSNDFESLELEYIEINLSVAQCIESDLYEKIDGLMKKYGVRPDQINLEITETGVDYDPVTTDRNIDLLRKRGITFSLDDYGTGYSSIKRVATLPLNMVKLDKSLVDEMDSPLMWIVIRNTVNMLKRMDKKILVEGVEDKRSFEKFVELGCDYIQGYYFSKPLNESSFLKFVISKNFGVDI